MLNVTSSSVKATVELPGAIVSGQSSSLHSNGAITTSSMVNVLDGSSENVAVNDISRPFAGRTTPTNV